MMQKLTAYFITQPTLQKILFIGIVSCCLLPFLSAPLALVLGFFTAQLIGNPYQERTKKLIHTLLQASVVGLGFGIKTSSALHAGRDGFIFTIVSIILVLLLGFLLAKILKINKITTYLITVGTAICGGSAIAAISPIVRAKPNQISIALAIIFSLNATALIIFPVIGSFLNLSQYHFGLWCAIAIHDTSAVVGAASKYGAEALQVATTVKLTRALWIIPLSLFSVILFKTKGTKIKIPWFIGFFIIAMILNTYFPTIQNISPIILHISKIGLTITLFLIGASLSFKTLKNIELKALLLAILLWLFISCTSLLVILKM